MGTTLTKQRERSTTLSFHTGAFGEKESSSASAIIAQNIPKFSILLVFQKPDKQSQLFEEAAKRLGCPCRLVTLNFGMLLTEAPNNQLSKWSSQFEADWPFDLIIIDRRKHLTDPQPPPQTIASQYYATPADAVRQELTTIPLIQHSVIAGLLPHRSSEKKHGLIASTLAAGYNKYIFELVSVQEAITELISFAHCELSLQRRCWPSRYSSFTADTPMQRTSSTTVMTSTWDPTIKSDQTPLNKLPSPNLSVSSTANKVLRSPHASFRMAQSETLYLDAREVHSTEGSGSTLKDSSPTIRANRFKSYTSFSRPRVKSQSIHGTLVGVEQDVIQNLLNGRYRESYLRFHSINSTAPLFKAVTILNTLKIKSSGLLARDLQKAMELIVQSDNFVAQLFKPISMQNRDPLTIDLMEGLMVSTTTNKPNFQLPRSASIGTALKAYDMLSTSSELLASDEIKACLEGDDRWDYNILTLELVTNRRPLTHLAMTIFGRFNVCNVLRIPESVMIAWLNMIQENYHQENPYHNATHAGDVLQSTAYLLRVGILSSVFDGLEEVGSLLAAVVHDLDHPGRTNPFLVNSNNPLAILYNDMTVLESHHVALAFELTRKAADVNIFQNLTREEYRTIRGYMVDMVLATEMAKHFDHVGRFVNTFTKPMIQKSRCHDQSSVGSMSSVESGSAGMIPSSSNSQLTTSATHTEDSPAHPLDRLGNAENRAILRRIIIKCSDVNNQTRPLVVCKEWASRIAEEYFCQTEEETKLGLPIVMPNFDRQTCNIPKSQISFIDFFLKDMFSAFDSVFPIPELMKNLESNYEHWKKASEEATTATDKAQS